MLIVNKYLLFYNIYRRNTRFAKKENLSCHGRQKRRFGGAKGDNGVARKRLAAKAFRREGVYNRAEKPSVTMVRAGSARFTAVTKWNAKKEERRNNAMRWFVYEKKEVVAS